MSHSTRLPLRLPLRIRLLLALVIPGHVFLFQAPSSRPLPSRSPVGPVRPLSLLSAFLSAPLSLLRPSSLFAFLKLFFSSLSWFQCPFVLSRAPSSRPLPAMAFAPRLSSPSLLLLAPFSSFAYPPCFFVLACWRSGCLLVVLSFFLQEKGGRCRSRGRALAEARSKQAPPPSIFCSQARLLFSTARFISCCSFCGRVRVPCGLFV